MEILILTSEEYQAYFTLPFHVYNSVEFTELNKGKCENVLYIAFKDSKVRLGITFGERNRLLCSPFSAPFGGFCFTKHEVTLQFIEDALKELVAFVENNNYRGIEITLPPIFYANDFLTKCFSVFMYSAFKLKYIDLNFQLYTACFENYTQFIARNSRKNLAIAQKNNLHFEKLENSVDFIKAYEVIKANRESRGYPLRMSWQQVEETIKVIKADFFILYNGDNAIAAAQVFYVTPEIVQVIYWGDTPGYLHQKPMNLLSYKVLEYYYNQGIKVVDIGPSTENGIPNHGLCEFKESIGCSMSSKFSFIYETFK